MAEPTAAIAKLNQDSLKELLAKYQPHMKRMLPRHLKPERMFQVAILGIQRTPKLLECTPASLVGSLLQCSQLGLEPDGLTGKAYLVPYWNSKVGRFVCEIIPGYKGLMDLARRSGHVSRFSAFAVYEGDEFDFEYGFQQKLHFKPRATDRSVQKLTHAFAMCYEDGEPKFYVSDRDEIDDAREHSKSADRGPWKDHFEAMAIKTAVRRFCKFLPTSTELAQAVSLDEMHESNVPQRLELLAPELMEPSEMPETEDRKRTGPATPQDVFAAGREVGWDRETVMDYIEVMYSKEITRLERGDECKAAIEAIKRKAAEDGANSDGKR